MTLIDLSWVKKRPHSRGAGKRMQCGAGGFLSNQTGWGTAPLPSRQDLSAKPGNHHLLLSVGQDERKESCDLDHILFLLLFFNIVFLNFQTLL